MDQADNLTDEDFAALAAASFKALDEAEQGSAQGDPLTSVKEGLEQVQRGDGIAAEDVLKPGDAGHAGNDPGRGQRSIAGG